VKVRLSLSLSLSPRLTLTSCAQRSPSLSPRLTFTTTGAVGRDDGLGEMLGVLEHEEAAAFFEEVG
jgi:hypothetical protein